MDLLFRFLRLFSSISSGAQTDVGSIWDPFGGTSSGAQSDAGNIWDPFG